jgi:hypothetical protein
MKEVVQILQRMRDDTFAQLGRAESGKYKVYSVGPGGASIDGTPQYIAALRQQTSELDKALAIASHTGMKPSTSS